MNGLNFEYDNEMSLVKGQNFKKIVIMTNSWNNRN